MGVRLKLPDLPRDVYVLTVIAFFVALGFGIVIPTLPVFAQSFGVTTFMAVAVVSVFALMRLVGAPPAGALVNRLGERSVLAAGLLIVAVSSGLAGLSQSYVQLLLLRGAGGIGSAMFTVAAMALLLRVAPAHQRGRSAGAFQAGFLIGGIAGPAVGGIVVAISIRAPFFFYAVTLLAATLVTVVFLKRPDPVADTSPPVLAEPPPSVGDFVPHTEPDRASGNPRDDATDSALDPASDDGTPTVRRDRPATFRAALRSRAYLAALIANLSNGWITFGLRSSLVPLFVVVVLGRSPQAAAVALLVSAVCQAAALWPAGRLADMYGRRPAMIAGTTLTALGMVVLAAASEDILFFTSMAVLGFGGAFLGSAPAAVVGDVMSGQRGGSVVAGFQMISDVGAIIGPLVAGAIADSAGYHWAFGTGVAIAAWSLWLSLRMPETRVTEDEAPANRVH